MKKCMLLVSNVCISIIGMTLNAEEVTSASAAKTVTKTAEAPKTISRALSDSKLTVDAKIGVIDSFAVMGDSIPGIEAREEIEGRRDEASKMLQEEAKKLEKAKNEYTSKATTMTETAREKEEKKLIKMDRDLNNTAQEKGEELKHDMQVATEKLAMDLDDAVVELAQVENLDLVVDKMTGRVLYASDKFDFTNKAIEKVNKRHEVKLAQNKKAAAEKKVTAVAENKSAQPAKSIEKASAA